MNTFSNNLTFAEQRIAHEQMAGRCAKLFSAIAATVSLITALMFL